MAGEVRKVRVGKTEMTNQSSMLFEKPRTYKYWWTFVPVLPRTREDQAYGMLRRQWADHTMNTLIRKGDRVVPGSRGMYVEGREDHITPCLFQIWAAFPGTAWVPRLLALWNVVPEGDVTAVRWSYSWEERRIGEKSITDIVVNWRDRRGDAVLVIEAKRKGGKLSRKDLDGGSNYLTMPSIRRLTRRHVGFLVDVRDAPTVTASVAAGTPVAVWQDMGRAQAASVADVSVTEAERSKMRSLIARHHSDHGTGYDEVAARALDGVCFDGSSARYEAVRNLNLPSEVELFYLGSEVSLCARRGVMPEPPFAWLAGEPSLLEIRALRQSTPERETAWWRLPAA